MLLFLLTFLFTIEIVSVFLLLLRLTVDIIIDPFRKSLWLLPLTETFWLGLILFYCKWLLLLFWYLSCDFYSYLAFLLLLMLLLFLNKFAENFCANKLVPLWLLRLPFRKDFLFNYCDRLLNFYFYWELYYCYDSLVIYCAFFSRSSAYLSFNYIWPISSSFYLNCLS